VHDITARKHSDGLLLAAKAEAEAANEAKSRFLAAASHDLRQPLTALSMYVGTLSRTAAASDQRLVSRIEGCVHGLSVLLSNLFDLSKLDSGAATVKPVEFAMKELFDSLETVYGGEAAGKGLRLRLRPTSARVRTDPYLLQRILGNLIANAIKFTERGGVLVACRRHACKMWVEVWDSGIGIADDKTEFIFEEFAQLGDSARNRGSGLGLSIVDKTAALLGLQVRIRSRPGRGSMFAVELPAAFDIAQNLVPTPAPPRVPRKLRIGLVEDNSAVLHALTLALSSTGHDVVSSTTGSGLLENLGGQAPQIIISDYRLAAGETGSDVIAAMRSAFGEELPGFVLTGNTDPALVRSMSEQRIAVHFKPVEVDALEAAIMEATGINA
jgi:CheY-like chemotaxis protein